MSKGLGLFSGLKRWIKKNVHIIAAVATVLGLPEIGAALEAYNSMGGMDNWKISVEGLDQKSADILDAWDTNKFTPFYTELLHILSKNVNNKLLDKKTRAQFANEILIKIAAVREYYISNGNEGLSNDGVLNRLQYLDDMLNILTNRILSPSELDLKSLFAELNLAYTQTDITQNFKSINLGILQLTVANDFNVTATVFNISNDVNALTPSPATVASNPTPTIDDIKNVIETAGGSTAGISNNPTPSPTTITKSTITKALGLLLIAIGLLSPSKNSSIKNQ
jgi:hypothetical protein